MFDILPLLTIVWRPTKIDFQSVFVVDVDVGSTSTVTGYHEDSNKRTSLILFANPYGPIPHNIIIKFLMFCHSLLLFEALRKLILSW